MGRLEQNLRKLAYAKSPDFDRVVQAYKDLYGVDLSHMRMKWSKHPVYNNGRRSYDFADDETGGSWVDDETIRINPKMGPVLKRFGIEGITQTEFRRRIIAHELAHEIYRKQRRRKDIKKLIRDSLASAKADGFTTPYLKTVPGRKMDEETFAEYMSDQLNKQASSLDLKNLFPSSKFPTEDELKEKEKSFSVGDRVKVSDHIRCLQKGRVGTIVRIDPKDKHGWKSFIVKFDDKKYGSMGFSSGNIDKVVEKKASSKKETYESGEGEVESYTPDKTKDHDEIVLRTKDGRRIVISNNTRLGKALKPRKGDSVGYHGYGVKGTNVIHKVHPNGRQRGGWLEHVKAASVEGDEITEKERRERRRRILRRAIIASIGAGALAAPAYYAHRLNQAGEAVSRIHDETNPHLSLGQLEKELNRQGHLPKVRVGSLSPLSLSRLLMRFKSGVPVYAKKHKGGYMNAAAVAKYDPNDPQKGFDRPFVLSLTTHPKILAHELGHVMDYKNGTFVRENFQRRKSRLKEAILTIVAPSKTTQMQNEIRAWDNARVDASDPLRRAALGTYFAGQRMNLAKDLKGPVALSSAIALGYDMKRGKKKREEEEEEKDSKKEQKTK